MVDNHFCQGGEKGADKACREDRGVLQGDRKLGGASVRQRGQRVIVSLWGGGTNPKGVKQQSERRMVAPT